jgi:hypothetical protein
MGPPRRRLSQGRRLRRRRRLSRRSGAADGGAAPARWDRASRPRPGRCRGPRPSFRAAPLGGARPHAARSLQPVSIAVLPRGRHYPTRARPGPARSKPVDNLRVTLEHRLPDPARMGLRCGNAALRVSLPRLRRHLRGQPPDAGGIRAGGLSGGSRRHGEAAVHGFVRRWPWDCEGTGRLLRRRLRVQLKAEICVTANASAGLPRRY